MAKVKFTAKRVQEFKCASESKIPAFLWDSEAPGLGLRVAPGGGKAYIFQGKLKGQVIRIRLGHPDDLSILEARAKATEHRKTINEGRDPRQVKADALAAEQDKRETRAAAKAAADAAAREAAAQAVAAQLRQSMTMAMAWPEYIKARRDVGRKGRPWSQWHLRDHENVVRRGGEPKKRGGGLTEPGPLAALLDVPLADLTGMRIGAWLAVEAQVRPARAMLAFRLLTVFIGWCSRHPVYGDLVEPTACKAQAVRDAMPAPRGKEISADCLQREQLAPWFDAVRKMGNPVQSAYLQALLLTGARRRELAGLRWVDVDFQWQKVTIRDKVQGTRTIPLTPYVAHLIAALPRNNEWVFSSASSASGQLAEPTPGHKRALADAALPDLTLHGLRRSFATLSEWVEVPAGVIAQIMGHKPSAVAEKHYKPRPIDLLRMWHVKIEEWMLKQAGISFCADARPSKLQLVG
jgi:integrase